MFDSKNTQYIALYPISQMRQMRTEEGNKVAPEQGGDAKIWTCLASNSILFPPCLTQLQK